MLVASDICGIFVDLLALCSFLVRRLADNLEVDHPSELFQGSYIIRLTKPFHRSVAGLLSHRESQLSKIPADVSRHCIVSLDPNVVCAVTNLGQVVVVLGTRQPERQSLSQRPRGLSYH